MNVSWRRQRRLDCSRILNNTYLEFITNNSIFTIFLKITELLDDNECNNRSGYQNAGSYLTYQSCVRDVWAFVWLRIRTRNPEITGTLNYFIIIDKNLLKPNNNSGRYRLSISSQNCLHHVPAAHECLIINEFSTVISYVILPSRVFHLYLCVSLSVREKECLCVADGDAVVWLLARNIRDVHHLHKIMLKLLKVTECGFWSVLCLLT